VPRHRFLNLDAATREGAQRLVRYAVDLGQAVAHWPPPDAEALGELRAERRLVEVARGARVRVDEPPVEGGPLAVGTLDQIGDHDVGVELGVPCAAGPMKKRGARNPARIDPATASSTATRDGERLVEVAESVGYGPLVRLADRCLHRRVADAEQDARALRRRERHVEAGHGAAAQELGARVRSLSRKRALQLFGAYGPGEPELGCAPSVPFARGLGAADVVVLGSRGDGMCRARVALHLVEVIPRLSCLELADGDHRPSGRRGGRSGHRISVGVRLLTDAARAACICVRVSGCWRCGSMWR
jgi:hypothetical protein